MWPHLLSPLARSNLREGSSMQLSCRMSGKSGIILSLILACAGSHFCPTQIQSPNRLAVTFQALTRSVSQTLLQDSSSQVILVSRLAACIIISAILRRVSASRTQSLPVLIRLCYGAEVGCFSSSHS